MRLIIEIIRKNGMVELFLTRVKKFKKKLKNDTYTFEDFQYRINETSYHIRENKSLSLTRFLRGKFELRLILLEHNPEPIKFVSKSPEIEDIIETTQKVIRVHLLNELYEIIKHKDAMLIFAVISSVLIGLIIGILIRPYLLHY